MKTYTHKHSNKHSDKNSARHYLCIPCYSNRKIKNNNIKIKLNYIKSAGKFGCLVDKEGDLLTYQRMKQLEEFLKAWIETSEPREISRALGISIKNKLIKPLKK